MRETREQESTPYGVGISKEGKHRRSLDYTPYRVWYNMLGRCYDTKNPAYDNWTVCDTWLEYQAFADWFIEQRGNTLGWDLDKDLLSTRLGIKTYQYSPEVCILLPKEINLTITVKKNKASGLPPGVHHNAKKTSFVARYRDIYSINTHIGTYTTVEEAYNAYKAKKQDLFSILANKYKNFLDIRAYDALLTFYTK
jgi:hypothetical protein